MRMAETELVFAAASLLCASISAVYDVRSRRIPNFITFPAILAGLAVHAALGGWRQFATAAVAGLLCGFSFLIFYLAGGMGAGDVKLITAAGCLAGLNLVPHLLILTALAGGAMAVCLALYHRRLAATFAHLRALIIHHKNMGLTPHPEFHLGNQQALRLPYAVAIAAGSAANLCLVAVQR